MTAARLLFCITWLACCTPVTALAWDNLTGGDHQGQDWILQPNTEVAGVHTNVGRLVIGPQVTVRVRPHDGQRYGNLEIEACELELDGTILADAAGLAGGQPGEANGGHQGQGPGAGCGGGPGGCVANGGSGGGYGGTGGQPEQDTNWNVPCNACDNANLAHCSGPGGSPYGTPSGTDLQQGSGGGAGGNSCGCNGAGGRGGQGGGLVKLLIDGNARIDGTISANGETSPLDESECGYHPGGGGGAGGGILLQAALLTGRGALRAQGGGGGPSDGCPSSCGDWGWAGGGGGGGRIKLFSPELEFAGTLQVEGGGGGRGAGGPSSYNGRAGTAGTVARVNELGFELPGCAGPPRIRLPQNVLVNQGNSVTLRAEGRDPDGGPLTWAWDTDGDELFDDGDEQELTIVFPDVADYPVAVQATDFDGETAVARTIVTVANVPPRITSGPPLQAREAVVWRYQVEAQDPGGAQDPLHLLLDEGPPGMAVDDAGLILTWTPTGPEALVGVVRIALRVRDSYGGSDSQNFPVQIAPLDSDMDQLPDAWELKYGLDPTDGTDAALDPDEDGLTSLEEFARHSNPVRAGKPDPPNPVAPEEGSWQRTRTPTLVVENTESPDGKVLAYGFQIARDAAFRELIQVQGGFPEGEGGQTSMPVRHPLEENSHYWWRAWAQDDTFSSEFSDSLSFVINSVAEPPLPPELLAPPDGLPVAELRPNLRVRPGADPDGDLAHIRFVVWADAQLRTIAAEGSLEVADGAGPVAWQPDVALADHGSYWWSAEALDEQGLSSQFPPPRSFKINVANLPPPPPELLRPSPGATLTGLHPELLLRLVDDPDGDALRVRVELSSTEQFTVETTKRWDDQTASAEGTLVLDPGKLLDNTRYWWRAQASDGLLTSDWAVATFLINRENEAPTSPLLRLPENGARLHTVSPELVAEAARDPDFDPLVYLFEIARDRNFQEVVHTSLPQQAKAGPADELEGAGEGEPEPDLVRWVTPPLEIGATYHWRCKAVDPLRVSSPWSGSRNFRIVSDAASQGLTVPQPIDPVAGQIVGSRPTLTFRAAVDPGGELPRYSIQVARPDGWEQPAAEATQFEAAGEQPSWTPSEPLADGDHVWRVRAHTSRQTSDWSAPATFVVRTSGTEEDGGTSPRSDDGCALAMGSTASHAASGSWLLLLALAGLLWWRGRRS